MRYGEHMDGIRDTDGDMNERQDMDVAMEGQTKDMKFLTRWDGKTDCTLMNVNYHKS